MTAGNQCVVTPFSRGACASQQYEAEECGSPFGTYELTVPVDENLDCYCTGFSNKNCRDLDVSIKFHLLDFSNTK